ncbi:MAG: hypothetical protein ACOCRX_00835, partial [Candidatus Woesearchaeota archaeon]
DNIEKFLLENGIDEIKNDDDVLKKAAGKITEMLDNMKKFMIDIDNINESISKLESVNIGNSVLEHLNNKIEEIQDLHNSTDKNVNDLLKNMKILLNIQLICPKCEGTGRLSIKNQDTRFNKPQEKPCDYCKSGSGYVTIEDIMIIEKYLNKKILEKEETKAYSFSRN